MNQKWESIT